MGNASRSANAANENKPKNHNRIRAIMIHLRRYWSMGASILARDVGVSKSTISHLLRGKSNPLYSTASRVVKCLESQLGFPLNPDEVFSKDGSYPTPYVCMLVGCKGCSADAFLDSAHQIRPGVKKIERGHCTGDNFELEGLSELERQDEKED
jgi:DNA-binding XRE family transcriptional regulator